MLPLKSLAAFGEICNLLEENNRAESVEKLTAFIERLESLPHSSLSLLLLDCSSMQLLRRDFMDTLDFVLVRLFISDYYLTVTF